MFSRSLSFGRSWRTAAHAYAHHNHKEEVLGEWGFGCQGTVPVFATQRKMGRRLFALHPIVLGKPRFSPLLKKLFQFFFEPVHQENICQGEISTKYNSSANWNLFYGNKYSLISPINWLPHRVSSPSTRSIPCSLSYQLSFVML